MRHRNKVKKLGRLAGPRKALLRGLVTNMVMKESITTTEAKAKTMRPMIEKLITTGKANTLNSRRALKRVLYTDVAVEKVLSKIAPRFISRAGGYVRITKLGFRQGDGSAMARIEFVA